MIFIYIICTTMDRYVWKGLMYFIITLVIRLAMRVSLRFSVCVYTTYTKMLLGLRSNRFLDFRSASNPRSRITQMKQYVDIWGNDWELKVGCWYFRILLVSLVGNICIKFINFIRCLTFVSKLFDFFYLMKSQALKFNIEIIFVSFWKSFKSLELQNIFFSPPFHHANVWLVMCMLFNDRHYYILDIHACINSFYVFLHSLLPKECTFSIHFEFIHSFIIWMMTMHRRETAPMCSHWMERKIQPHN